jgi:hypothetical protein
MTTTTEYLGDEALDDLLNEADSLMIDLDVNDNNDAEAIGNANGDDLVIDGFAIDSDEEEDGGASTSNKNNQSVDVHPLSDEWIAANTPPPAPPSGSAPPSVGSGTFAPSTGMATVGTAQTNGSFGAGGMVHANPLSGGAVTMDNLKQQTSRFASNLANMAQRAASQVASVTVVQPNPMMMAQPMPPQHYGNQNSYAPQQQQLQHQMQHQQAGIPQSPGILSSSAAGGQQQQQQQQPNGVGASELDKDQINRLVQEHAGELLPGERIIMFLSNLLHVGDTTGLSYASNQSSDAYMWCCAMSYYRVILFSTTTPDQQRQVSLQCPEEWDPRCWPAGPEAVKFVEMPLASIDRVEKSIYQANNSSYLGIIMYSKDGSRNMRFSTPSHADTGQAFKSLQTYSFPGRRNLGYLFAFESKRQKVMASVKIDEGTGQQTIAIPPTPKRFDAMIEYPRLLSKSSTTQCPWAIWASVNSSYGLSPSYPSVLCGPATLDETKQDTYIVIRQCAAFRSEQRMPSLTWCSVGGSSIWRSSQPKIGLQGNRSQADELFLRHIVESARSANAIADPPPIYSRMALQRLTGDYSKDWTPEHGCGLKIMDLRPRSSAMANRTGGE